MRKRDGGIKEEREKVVSGDFASRGRRYSLNTPTQKRAKKIYGRQAAY